MKKIVFFLLIISISCKEKTNESVSHPEKIQNTKDSVAISVKDSAENLIKENPTVDASKPVKKTVKCEEKGGNMEIGFTTECLWENYTLEETYFAFKEKHKNNDEEKFLESKMPQANHKATFKEYPLSVDYKYSGKDELNIEILFPGGVTFITLKKMENGVKSIVVHSPD